MCLGAFYIGTAMNVATKSARTEALKGHDFSRAAKRFLDLPERTLVREGCSKCIAAQRIFNHSGCGEEGAQ